jgi:hypothetical protein
MKLFAQIDPNALPGPCPGGVGLTTALGVVRAGWVIDGSLLATHPDGIQFFKKLLDNTGTPPGAGTLFGLAFASEGLYFVDDGTNTLNLLH